MEQLLDRYVEIDIDKTLVLKLEPISERLRPKFRTLIAPVLPKLQLKGNVERREEMESLLDAIAQVGEFDIYSGYKLALVRMSDVEEVDTPDQKYYWRVSWVVKDVGPEHAWDSTNLVQPLPAPMQKRSEAQGRPWSRGQEHADHDLRARERGQEHQGQTGE